MKRFTKVFPFVFFLMLFTRNSSAEETSYTKEQLHQELEWVGRSCVRPNVPPPPPILVVIPELETNGTAYHKEIKKSISLRRWIDIDGDGICEVFDVHKPEFGSTGRFYGYPAGGLKYTNRIWTNKFDLAGDAIGGGGWFPLVMKDKRSRKTNILYSPFYGLGGIKLDALGVDSFWNRPRFRNCDEFRTYISLAYLLIFHPPQELVTDELMSDDFTGGDYVFAVFPGLRALTEKAESMACITPYLNVAADIDKRVRELYPAYFSGLHGLK